MRKTLITLAVAALTFVGLPAQAYNNSWITFPQLSEVKVVATNSKSIGAGYSLSTQSTGFDLVYNSSSGNAGKFAQINIFDVTGALGLTLAVNSVGTSSTACDPQVLSTDSHTCFFKLDGLGKARIHAQLSNVSAAGAFKFKILAGPNIQESGIAQVLFVAPTNKVVAVTSAAKAMLGGAGLVQFKITQDGKPAAGIRVTVSFKGVGSNLSTSVATSNSKGLLTVYLSNLTKTRGASVVSVKIDGGTASAKATINWVSGSLGH
jgi:hypothetical protein